MHSCVLTYGTLQLKLLALPLRIIISSACPGSTPGSKFLWLPIATLQTIFTSYSQSLHSSLLYSATHTTNETNAPYWNRTNTDWLRASNATTTPTELNFFGLGQHIPNIAQGNSKPIGSIPLFSVQNTRIILSQTDAPDLIIRAGFHDDLILRGQ